MAQFLSITPASLNRLIGTPAAPVVIDVRLPEDVATLPAMIPTARKLSHHAITKDIDGLMGRHVVLICHKGLKLSHGAAAILRASGIRAEVLEGGIIGWQDAKLPMIPINTLPANVPGSTWVTKQRPKIDRIACPWLIRRFVDPQARFLFVPAAQVLAVADRFTAISFDVPGAEWTHQGDNCTFDHLMSGFGLNTRPLETMARVIRGADTNDHTLAPECAGLLALSVGLSRAHTDDLEQLEAGMGLYDALYRWARDGQNEGHDWQEPTQ